VWSHYLWLKQNAETRGRVQPSTAPCYPTPGKRFLIIRTEVQPQQPLLTGFDLFPGTLGLDAASDYRGAYSGTGDNSAETGRADGGVTSNKKKWTLLGKVLAFAGQQAGSGNPGAKRSWDEELEQARRETAAARSAAARSSQSSLLQPAGPPPPPKRAPSNGVISSSDSGSSTGSAPVYDAAMYVFRFALSWQGQNGAYSPPRDRILSRPRLPAPAHARVSARAATLNGAGQHGGECSLRNESPPPIAPGLPPDTRRVSGLMQTGLVSEARNARPLSLTEIPNKTATEKTELRRLSLNIDVTSVRLPSGGPGEDGRLATRSPTPVFDGYESDRGRSFDVDGERARPHPPAVRAVKPVGVYASGAVYSGRALAEWSLVVSECNSFVERRRDEGVLGLSDVEVPALSVEGLGLRQRG
jgi:hypothetical protein